MRWTRLPGEGTGDATARSAPRHIVRECTATRLNRSASQQRRKNSDHCLLYSLESATNAITFIGKCTNIHACIQLACSSSRLTSSRLGPILAIRGLGETPSRVSGLVKTHSKARTGVAFAENCALRTRRTQCGGRTRLGTSTRIRARRASSMIVAFSISSERAGAANRT